MRLAAVTAPEIAHPVSVSQRRQAEAAKISGTHRAILRVGVHMHMCDLELASREPSALWQSMLLLVWAPTAPS